MTAPGGGGADEIREQLAAALPESLGPVGLRRRAIPALDVQGSVTGYGVALLDALLPTAQALIAAGAAAELRAAAAEMPVSDDDCGYAIRNGLRPGPARWLRDRADALDGTP